MHASGSFICSAWFLWPGREYAWMCPISLTHIVTCRSRTSTSPITPSHALRDFPRVRVLMSSSRLSTMDRAHRQNIINISSTVTMLTYDCLHAFMVWWAFFTRKRRCDMYCWKIWHSLVEKGSPPPPPLSWAFGWPPSVGFACTTCNRR